MAGGTLDTKYRDHDLTGNYKGYVLIGFSYITMRWSKHYIIF